MTPEAIVLWAMAFFGQVPPPPLVGVTSDIAWDPVTQNVAGQPDVIALYDIAATDPAVDLNAGGPSLAVGTELPSDVPDIGCQRLLGNLKNGTYSIQVRARNAAGNFSAWSEKLLVNWNGVAPATPTGLRVKGTP